MHGWGGHALASFKAKSQSPYIWIRDSLPFHFPQLRVWTYGYESKLADADSIGDVDDFAHSFWLSLKRLRKKTQVKQSVLALKKILTLLMTF